MEIYRMNPAEDDLLYGDDLEEGMWVLPAPRALRTPVGDSEEDQIRSQCFRQVTRLRRSGDQVVFTGRWADGYAMLHDCHAVRSGWLVRRRDTLTESGPRKIAAGA